MRLLVNESGGREVPRQGWLSCWRGIRQLAVCVLGLPRLPARRKSDAQFDHLNSEPAQFFCLAVVFRGLILQRAEKRLKRRLFGGILGKVAALLSPAG